MTGSEQPNSEKTQPTSRAAAKARTHARVLRAALAVFREYGYEAATTAEIARRANVSHGTVFTVAPTKVDLLAAAFHASITEVVDRIARTLPPDETLLDQLCHVFGSFFDHYQADPALARVLVPHSLFLSHPESRRQQGELLLRFLNLIESIVESQRQRAGIAKDASSRDIAGNCFAIYLAFLIAMLNDRYSTPREHRKAFAHQLELSLKGVIGSARV